MAYDPTQLSDEDRVFIARVAEGSRRRKIAAAKASFVASLVLIVCAGGPAAFGFWMVGFDKFIVLALAGPGIAATAWVFKRMHPDFN